MNVVGFGEANLFEAFANQTCSAFTINAAVSREGGLTEIPHLSWGTPRCIKIEEIRCRRARGAAD
jgi:hypothetical protein